MLKGEHIILRALNENDLASVNEWRNDLNNKILAQGFRLPVTSAMDKAWFEEKTFAKDDKNIYFIVAEIESDKPIGIIQINNINYISGTAVWGFIIGEKNKRGTGIEIEAPRLLLNYAFNVLNLRKLTSYTLDIRYGTQRLLKRVGKIREEGILKEHYFYNGIYYNIHIQSFFREDFPEMKF